MKRLIHALYDRIDQTNIFLIIVIGIAGVLGTAAILYSCVLAPLQQYAQERHNSVAQTTQQIVTLHEQIAAQKKISYSLERSQLHIEQHGAQRSLASTLELLQAFIGKQPWQLKNFHTQAIKEKSSYMTQNISLSVRTTYAHLYEILRHLPRCELPVSITQITIASSCDGHIEADIQLRLYAL